jgi:NAD(P)H dehydrogenase (quinone)
VRGIRVRRRGDFADAASLAHAFDGADQVLLVSAATSGETALRQHRTAIDAARVAGVRRIVYTSHMGSNPASPFAPMRDHAATEEMLQGSGVAVTALRNGFYASSGLTLLGRHSTPARWLPRRTDRSPGRFTPTSPRWRRSR